MSSNLIIYDFRSNTNRYNICLKIVTIDKTFQYTRIDVSTFYVIIIISTEVTLCSLFNRIHFESSEW